MALSSHLGYELFNIFEANELFHHTSLKIFNATSSFAFFLHLFGLRGGRQSQNSILNILSVRSRGDLSNASGFQKIFLVIFGVSNIHRPGS